MLSTWVLAWLHVISAIGWLGGGILFGFVVAPLLSTLSPATSAEFVLKVIPRVARFFQVAAGLTVVFGVLLLLDMGGLGLLNTSTFYGALLTVGVTLALIAFLISELVAVPAQLKVVRVVRDMVASPPVVPSPALPGAVRRATVTAVVALVFLLGASICMVGAGFY